LPFDVCARCQLTGDVDHIVVEIGGDEAGAGKGLLQMTCNAARATSYFQDVPGSAGSRAFYDMPGIRLEDIGTQVAVIIFGDGA